MDYNATTPIDREVLATIHRSLKFAWGKLIYINLLFYGLVYFFIHQSSYDILSITDSLDARVKVSDFYHSSCSLSNKSSHWGFTLLTFHSGWLQYIGLVA